MLGMLKGNCVLMIAVLIPILETVLVLTLFLSTVLPVLTLQYATRIDSDTGKSKELRNFAGNNGVNDDDSHGELIGITDVCTQSLWIH